DPSLVTEIALIRKSVTGPGIVPYWTQLNYGAANDCYGGNGYRTTCTSSSPTTTTTTVTRSDGTSTVLIFGNRYMFNQGLLLRKEERQSVTQVLSVETSEWTLFDGIGTPGLGLYSSAGS